LASISALYLLGVARLWRHAGIGRGLRGWQVGCFVAAIVTLIVALLSPIAAISEQLLSIHMIQHMLLMIVAAPLLAAASPILAVAWALPTGWRIALARAWARVRPRPRLSWQPVFAWLSFALVLWIWHIPALYQAAVRHPRIHDLQHLAFFGSACLYWRVMFEPIGRVRLSPAAAVVHVFTTSLHGMLLGVLIALSPRLWYPVYQRSAGRWGLTAIEDQQIAGFIMWMPVCGVYAVIAVVMLAVWLHRAERAGEGGAER
ncbi:MAG TPA: cytochrome c oxidase assembly protein, partial [Enhygromyxa sp.]|nr:cytochrome c oxidase assembly protein [Enhygromyxa sp.]